MAAYAVFLLVLVAVAADSGSFATFFDWLTTPVSAVLHGLVLAAVLFHTATWIALMPKSMEIRLGEEQVPDLVVAAAGFAALIGVSLLVAFLALR